MNLIKITVVSVQVSVFIAHYELKFLKNTKYQVEVKVYTYRELLTLQEYKFTSTKIFLVFQEFELYRISIKKKQ